MRDEYEASSCTAYFSLKVVGAGGYGGIGDHLPLFGIRSSAILDLTH